MRTHLISQVVLKQFTNKDGLVAQHEKLSGTVTLLPPVDIAYTEIDRAIIEQSEQEWSSDIENDSEKALNTLINGNILHVPKHTQTIKTLMALHYVRSFALIQLMAIAMPNYAKQIIENVTAVYPSHKELVEKKVAEDWPRMMVESLPKIIKANITKVKQFMERHGLEVGVSPEDELFIIGDIPTITLNSEGKIGVPITEADNFAMPLTPRHIVALKTKPTKKYTQLTPKHVQAANKKQEERALEVFYSQH